MVERLIVLLVTLPSFFVNVYDAFRGIYDDRPGHAVHYDGIAAPHPPRYVLDAHNGRYLQRPRHYRRVRGLAAYVGQKGKDVSLYHLRGVGRGEVVGNHHGRLFYVGYDRVLFPGKVHYDAVDYVLYVGTPFL